MRGRRLPMASFVMTTWTRLSAVHWMLGQLARRPLGLQAARPHGHGAPEPLPGRPAPCCRGQVSWPPCLNGGTVFRAEWTGPGEPREFIGVGPNGQGQELRSATSTSTRT